MEHFKRIMTMAGKAGFIVLVTVGTVSLININDKSHDAEIAAMQAEIDGLKAVQDGE